MATYGTGTYGQYIYGGPVAASLDAVPPVLNLGTGAGYGTSAGAVAGSTPYKVVSTNLVTNPRPPQSSVNAVPDAWNSQWFGGNGGSGSWSVDPIGRVTKTWNTDVNTGGSNWDIWFGPYIPVVPGQKISARLSAVIEAAPGGLPADSVNGLMTRVYWQTSAHQNLSWARTDTFIPWSDITVGKEFSAPDLVDAVAPADAAYAYVHFIPAPTSSPEPLAKAGTVIKVFDPIVVSGGPIPAYFYGGTQDEGRTVFEWTGTPNASTSIKKVESYSGMVLADGPVGYWRLGESSKTIAYDSSLRGHNGEYVGTFPASVPGALTVEGNDDGASVWAGGATSPRVRWANPDWLPFSSPMTIESWVKTSVTRNKTLFSYAVNNVLGIYPFQTSTGIWWNGADRGFLDHKDIADDKWHHHVLVFDGTSLWFVIDGEPTESISATGLSSTSGYLVLGQDQDGNDGGYSTSQDWVGTIDEVAIYPRALSQTEILEHYDMARHDRFIGVQLDAVAPGRQTEISLDVIDQGEEQLVNLIDSPHAVDTGGGGAAWHWGPYEVFDTGGFAGREYRRLTADGTAPPIAGLYYGGVVIPKDEVSYFVSYRLRASKSVGQWRVVMEWRRPDNTLISTSQTNQVNSIADEWVEVSGNVVAPAGTAGVTFCMYSSNMESVVAGDTFDFDAMMTVKSDSHVSYFDGNSIQGTRNLAAGAAVTGDTLSNPYLLTDGSTSHAPYSQANPGLKSVTVDLKSAKWLDRVHVWHYWYDLRTYHQTKTEVSEDGVNWTVIFDSAVEGEYQETDQGRIHNFTLRKVRYIRDWLNGSTSNTGNHWCEIQAFNTSEQVTFEWEGTPNNSPSIMRRKSEVALRSSLNARASGAATVHHEDSVTVLPILLPIQAPPTPYWNGLFAVPAALVFSAIEPTRTVYIKPLKPTYTDLQYRAKFTEGFTKIIRRVEILEADGQTLWDDQADNKSRLISGNVSIDYDRDERRSLDLELTNFDGALVHKPEGFWYDKVIRCFRGIEFYDRSGRRSYEVPVGSFMIDRVVEARFPKTVKVTARDYTKKCILSKFTAATAFTADQAIEDVIAAMAGTVGVQRRVFPATGKTLGVDTFFERGKSRWEAMKEIATAHGYELFFDAYGYLVMREFLDPTLSPISHEFLTGPVVGNLVDWERSANDTRIFNHISVIGADTDASPVWADAYNTNPLSPTNIDLLGDRVDTFESALVTTFAQATALAETFLKVAALEEYEINLSSIVYPWLEAGEIVKFSDPERINDEPDRFLLTSFNIPMGLEPMSAVGRRVVIVS